MNSTRFASLALVVAALGLGGSAFAAAGETGADSAAPVSTLDLAFDLFAGGIPLGHVSMSARVQGTDYTAISSLDTRGLVNAFWQSKIETSSSGTLTAQNVQPDLYASFSQYRSKRRRQVTLTFGPEGPSVYSDPPYQESAFAVTDAEKMWSLDPLSAVMFLIGSHASDSEPCETRSPLFSTDAAATMSPSTS